MKATDKPLSAAGECDLWLMAVLLCGGGDGGAGGLGCVLLAGGSVFKNSIDPILGEHALEAGAFEDNGHGLGQGQAARCAVGLAGAGQVVGKEQLGFGLVRQALYGLGGIEPGNVDGVAGAGLGGAKGPGKQAKGQAEGENFGAVCGHFRAFGCGWSLVHLDETGGEEKTGSGQAKKNPTRSCGFFLFRRYGL